MRKKLYRNTEDKMFCGVCSGLADYFDVDPTLVRLGAVLLFVLNPAVTTILYIAACLIVPEKPGADSEKTRSILEELDMEWSKSSDQLLIIIGTILVGLGALVLFVPMTTFITSMFIHAMFNIYLLVLGIILLVIGVVLLALSSWEEKQIV